jgi:phospholipid transport system transporter-binding protein
VSSARLPERLTLDDAAATLAVLRGAVAGQAVGDVTVHAGALRHFDSSAVAVLLELRRELAQQGRALRVHDWPPRLQDLVKVYGVQELLGA